MQNLHNPLTKWWLEEFACWILNHAPPGVISLIPPNFWSTVLRNSMSLVKSTFCTSEEHYLLVRQKPMLVVSIKEVSNVWREVNRSFPLLYQAISLRYLFDDWIFKHLFPTQTHFDSLLFLYSAKRCPARNCLKHLLYFDFTGESLHCSIHAKSLSERISLPLTLIYCWLWYDIRLCNNFQE